MTFGRFAPDIMDYKSGYLPFGTKQMEWKHLFWRLKALFKKVDKVPSNEIDRAVKIMTKYFESKLKK